MPFCDGQLTSAHQVPSPAFEVRAPPPWPTFGTVTSLHFFFPSFPSKSFRTSSVSWSACLAGFVPLLDGKQTPRVAKIFCQLPGEKVRLCFPFDPLGVGASLESRFFFRPPSDTDECLLAALHARKRCRVLVGRHYSTLQCTSLKNTSKVSMQLWWWCIFKLLFFITAHTVKKNYILW